MAGIEIARKEDLDALASSEELENVENKLGSKADSSHTHKWDDITDAPEIPVMPDTSGFATKEEVNSKADGDHRHSYNDLDDKPEIPITDGLAKQTDLDDLAGIVNTLKAEVESLKGDTEE